jgi:hypothetical protein
LKVLNISGRKNGIETISALKNVTSIIARNCEINDLKIFKECSNLKKLDIADNCVDFGTAHTLNCLELDELTFYFTCSHFFHELSELVTWESDIDFNVKKLIINENVLQSHTDKINKSKILFSNLYYLEFVCDCKTKHVHCEKYIADNINRFFTANELENLITIKFGCKSELKHPKIFSLTKKCKMQTFLMGTVNSNKNKSKMKMLNSDVLYCINMKLCNLR